MSDSHFDIVFQKLNELAEDSNDGSALVVEVDQLAGEMDELAELRRLTESVTEPTTSTYTST